MIPHSFWKDVEKPMKYVQYGDSVAGEAKITVKFNDSVIENIQFTKIWNILVKDFHKSVSVINNKEYMLDIQDVLQIANYDVSNDSMLFTSPKYIMRHLINTKCVEMVFDNGVNLTSTTDHSMLEYDGLSLEKTPPSDLRTAASFENGVVVKANVKSLKTVYYDGYVYDFEIPGTHNFVANGVVVHNTDSLYISLDQDTEKTAEELLELSDGISNDINNQIKYFIESFLLPKLGVDIAYNQTFFKTELVADAIMFLDIKKNYAFRELASKGRIHKEPKIKYTGIPVVRTNISNFTKSFIRELVEGIALNPDIDKSEMKAKLHEVAKKYWSKLKEDCANCDLTDIGIPCKWSNSAYTKETANVIAMRAYNTFIGEDVLMPSQSALHFPVKLTNQSALMTKISKLKNRSEFCLGSININDINYFAMPFNCTPQQLKKIMVDFDLAIDDDKYWDILYNKVAKRIVDAIKQYVIQ